MITINNTNYIEEKYILLLFNYIFNLIINEKLFQF